jgi:excisionase family DNA binding protein
MEPILITKTELAERLGVHLHTITKYVKAGKLPGP